MLSAFTVKLRAKLAGRLAVNFYAQMGVFGVNLGVGLFLTPFLISHLGAALYGFVPLATQVANYATIVTSALNAAVAREVASRHAQGRLDEARAYYSTTIALCNVLAVVLLPLAVGAIFVVVRTLNIPTNSELSVILLLAASFAGFTLQTIRLPYEIASFTKERIDLRALIQLWARLLYVAVIVGGFLLGWLNLEVIAVAVMVSSGYTLWHTKALARRLLPEMGFNRRLIRMDYLRDSLGFGGWVFLNQIGAVIFLNSQIFVANLALGAVVAGCLAAITQWGTIVRSFAGFAVSSISPRINRLFAQGDVRAVDKLVVRSMLALGLFAAVAAGAISGMGEWLSVHWLKADGSYAALFPALLIPMSVNIVVLPLFSLQTAARSNQLSAIFTLLSGLAAVGVSYGVGHSSENPVVFVWLYNGIFALKNLLFMPFHGGRLLGGGGGKLLVITLCTVMVTIFIYLAVRAGAAFFSV